MAVTKIHAINATVGKAIAYICNPHKTDDNVLVSTFRCGQQTAELDFKFVLSKTRQPDSNKAYHIIQSFAPGEVSGEEAHRIGQELADKFLQGKYSYVFATHTDRDHIHNHLIFCAADNINHHKYRSTINNYYKIRDISDKLCAEHGKSVIKEYKETGKTYNEWFHDKKGDSWKSQIKKDIDECVKNALSYDDFLNLMKDNGYEINGEAFGNGAAKYISFRPIGKDRFVRGRASTLGPEYTKECIKERIEAKGVKETKRFSEINSSAGAETNTNYTPAFSGIKTTLIDMTSKKVSKSIAYTRWAQKENLKRTAAMYAELGRLNLQSKSARASRIKELQEQIMSERKQVNILGKEIKHFEAILRHAKYLQDNKKYITAYEKAKDQDEYYRNHADQLETYWGAVSWLKKAGIDAEVLEIQHIKNHYNKLISGKSTLLSSFTTKQKECNQLLNVEKNLTLFLNNNDTINKNLKGFSKTK